MLWFFSVSHSAGRGLMSGKGAITVQCLVLMRFINVCVWGMSSVKDSSTPGLSDLCRAGDQGIRVTLIWLCAVPLTLCFGRGAHHFLASLSCLVFVMGIISTYLMRQLCQKNRWEVLMSERYFKVLRDRQHLNPRNYYYIRNLIILSRKQTSKAKETNLMNGRNKCSCTNFGWRAEKKLTPAGLCRSFHTIGTVSPNNLRTSQDLGWGFPVRSSYCWWI